MGGRGASGGSRSITAQLRQMKQKGQFPVFILGRREQQIEVFKAINDVFTLPQDLQSFMKEKFDNGYKKVQEINVGGNEIRYRFGSDTIRTSYPSGDTQNETEQIRDGARKWLLINAWRKKRKNG